MTTTLFSMIEKKRYMVKPVNKDHPSERSNMAFKDKWSLFRGYLEGFMYSVQGCQNVA